MFSRGAQSWHRWSAWCFLRHFARISFSIESKGTCFAVEILPSGSGFGSGLDMGRPFESVISASLEGETPAVGWAIDPV